MRARYWMLVSAALIFTAFESGFLIYQRTVQEQFLERLTDPGAVSDSVIITVEPIDSGVFSRRDRVTVRVGSSIYGDAKEAPLSLQMDVEADYGLLGLSGRIKPLANTRSVTDILDMIEGDRPDLDIRYGVDGFSKDLILEATISPFNVCFVEENPLIQTVWRAGADDPVHWRVRLTPQGYGTSELSAKNARIVFDDGIGGEMVAKTEGFRVRHDLRRSMHNPNNREWFIEKATSVSDKQTLTVNDHRGALELVLRNLSTEAERRRAGDGTLDGDYGFDAKTFTLSLKPEGRETQKIEGEKLRLRTHGDNVPLELFEPMDEVDLEAVLKKAESVRFRLDELSFRTKGLLAMVKGHLTAHWGHHEERREACLEFPDEGFNVGWSLEVELPDALLSTVSALAGGRVKGFDPADFMVAKELHGAPYHTLDFRGDLKRGAELNGMPAGF